MAERVDETGAAFAGSQLQTQLYVNERTEELDEAIRSEFSELAAAEFEWRSPLADDRYREYYGRGFLERVDLAQHAAALNAFWPSRGPQWDGLAVVHQKRTGRPGVLLVEGKSYPDEMLKGSGTTAKLGTVSRALIDRSLAWTQRRLGVQGKAPADWCGSLYQNANRLAHLCWLQSLGVRAWFVHLLFVGDLSNPRREPTTTDEWAVATRTANEQLGLAGITVGGAGHVLLAAGPRDELIG